MLQAGGEKLCSIPFMLLVSIEPSGKSRSFSEQEAWNCYIDCGLTSRVGSDGTTVEVQGFPVWAIWQRSERHPEQTTTLHPKTLQPKPETLNPKP